MENLRRKNPLELIITKVFVNFGAEILKHIPGRVSTEVDARLSFDVEGSIKKPTNILTSIKKLELKKSVS